MVKAYGRHFKLDKAYQIADMMRENNMKIGISTINSLMYAAISDKESGLKHVIKTWQLMRKLTVCIIFLYYFYMKYSANL